MPHDIFISYAREDRERVRLVAEELASRGYTVWWDTTGLRGGEDYELLYTGPAGLPGIMVGRVVGLDPAALIMFRDEPLQPEGYDHFS